LHASQKKQKQLFKKTRFLESTQLTVFYSPNWPEIHGQLHKSAFFGAFHIDRPQEIPIGDFIGKKQASTERKSLRSVQIYREAGSKLGLLSLVISAARLIYLYLLINPRSCSARDIFVYKGHAQFARGQRRSDQFKSHPSLSRIVLHRSYDECELNI